MGAAQARIMVFDRCARFGCAKASLFSFIELAIASSIWVYYRFISFDVNKQLHLLILHLFEGPYLHAHQEQNWDHHPYNTHHISIYQEAFKIVAIVGRILDPVH